MNVDNSLRKKKKSGLKQSYDINLFFDAENKKFLLKFSKNYDKILLYIVWRRRKSR